MNKTSFTTFALTAALAIGGLALASFDANAAAFGRGPAGSPPAHSDGTPGAGGGGDSPIQVLLDSRTDCPPTIAATACGKHVKRKPVEVVVQRCANWDYPRIVLPSGFIVVDYNAEKVRYCGNLPAM